MKQTCLACRLHEQKIKVISLKVLVYLCGAFHVVSKGDFWALTFLFRPRLRYKKSLSSY